VQSRNVQLALLRLLLWNKQSEELEKYFDNLQRDYEAGKIADYELLWSYRAFRVTHAGYEPLFKEWQRQNPTPLILERGPIIESWDTRHAEVDPQPIHPRSSSKG
jgi:hypothetical protein